jgi:hypothetical protein
MHFSTRQDFETLNIAARDPEERKKRLRLWQSDPVFLKYNEEFFEKETNLTKTNETDNA